MEFQAIIPWILPRIVADGRFPKVPSKVLWDVGFGVSTVLRPFLGCKRVWCFNGVKIELRLKEPTKSYKIGFVFKTQPKSATA